MAAKGVQLVARHQPHIETLQVSVQVVRIGPKQMTLAVFRQLKKVFLLEHETLELRGIPWGTVQYKPGDCDEDLWYDHPHVVWQQGAELRRCCWPRQWWDGVEEDLRRQFLAAGADFPPPLGLRAMTGPLALAPLQEAWEKVAAHVSLMKYKSPRDTRAVEAFAVALRELEHAMPGIRARRSRWTEHQEEIDALPQLFIVV